jgi:hypothetical protein
MVKFKVIKYKHYLEAVRLTNLTDAGTDVEDEHFRFVLEQVSEWDFKDVETEEPLPPGVDSIAELTIIQLNELTSRFNELFVAKTTVPKTNAGYSPYTSTTSKPEEKTPATSQSGSTPS